MFVLLPEELKKPGYCGELSFNLYGTRRAAAAWEEDYSAKLKEWGFIRGASCPVIFRHDEKALIIVVHGDDCLCLGSEEELDWFKGNMQSAYQCRATGRAGPEEQDGKPIKNRSGNWLCADFQAGQCTESRDGWCAKHDWPVHQCARCVAGRHGAHRPNECAQEPKETRQQSRKRRKRQRQGQTQ